MARSVVATTHPFDRWLDVVSGVGAGALRQTPDGGAGRGTVDHVAAGG
jgi:hypothetical protein